MMEEDTQVSSNTLLEETFYITSKKNTFYKVKLTEKGLSLHKESNGSSKTETITLSDIIGCRCMRSKRRSTGSCACHSGISKSQTPVVESTEAFNNWDEMDTSAYLYIYAYTLKKARVKGVRRRGRTTITLRFRSFDKYDDNLREASRWRLAIKCLIARIPIPKNYMSPSHGNLETLLNACPNEQKKILVLLNPKSGQGRGREIFQKRIHPILIEAEKQCDVHITKYPNYARDFVRTRDISQWSGILSIGGDGILFEVLNGIFERPDWAQILADIPLGIIPCGSGNGIARSIAYAKAEPYESNPMLVGALSVVKGKSAPIDVVRLETRSQILYSFLSVGWGFIADIDIESERLRAIGAQRFTIWSIARLIGLRIYKGTISYLPCDKTTSVEYKTNSNLYKINGNNDEIISHAKSYGDSLDRYCSIKEARSCHDVLDSITNNLSDNELIGENISLETEVQTRTRLDSFYSATSKKSTYFSTGSNSTYHSIDENNSSTRDNDANEVDGNRVMYGPSSTLPALTAQVPSNWTIIKGEFVAVQAAYQSHISKDAFIAPQAKLADGVIWLLIIKAGITRTNMLQFLLGVNSGAHLNCSGVDMIPVKAFRIEPEEDVIGNLTVDGEKVDYGPLQAEIFPCLANIMTP